MGPDRVQTACARAAESEAFNVGLIGRMIERATEGRIEEVPLQGRLISPRFARPVECFAVETRTVDGEGGAARTPPHRPSPLK